MSEHFMFNSFNTLIGLGLTICAFIMQEKIDNVCGSKPLRNSILGILVIGMTMFWLGGLSLLNGEEIFTKNMFAGFVGALGATLVGLGSVIVQNSKQECSKDIVCNQTTKNKNSTPCEGAKAWGAIVVTAGCLMIVGAGIHAMFETGTDKLLTEKYGELGGLQGIAQRAKKAATKARGTAAAERGQQVTDATAATAATAAADAEKLTQQMPGAIESRGARGRAGAVSLFPKFSKA